MAEEQKQEYKKYGQFVNGQFRKTSKKAIALFIGRSIQLLTASVEQFREEKKLRMDTLRFLVHHQPMENEDGEIIPNWEYVTVAYEVGSMDPYTEEDRKQDEERRKAREEARRAQEEEIGEAAMKEIELNMHKPKVESEIQ